MPAPLKVLVVGDEERGAAATQVISFGQPLAGAPGIEVTLDPHRGERSAIAARIRDTAPDIIVLSRYTWEQGKIWADYAHAKDIALLFHLDDDLLAVPESLGAHKFAIYNDPERLAVLRASIESADLVYASTPALAERLAGHGVETPIIAGDIYCSVAPDDIGALLPPAQGPVMGYMGTGGHSADLAMVLPAICALLDRLPTLHFELFGTIQMPGELKRFGHRVRHLPFVVGYDAFMPQLRTLGWWVGLAPLEDNSFNRCKADTKWVEYTTASIATVASDLPVYAKACSDGCGLLARGTEEWIAAMETLLVNPAQRQAMIGAAQDKLRAEYSHARLREQVLRVLDAVQHTARARVAGAEAAG
ncbi:glycosyltransferase [Rhodobacter sp. NTK016B]|uniref:glycosyltransferase n=1 Tax=Rhodobacter sp. NTK016B TaxID=2759676 RepID=UPI001A8D5A9D|nr:glycosyltransferase [Rhodobacter sp. NTK016B]MBN8291133.1 glycosyltransferase [Rhodobacter sp. NTK016B]